MRRHVLAFAASSMLLIVASLLAAWLVLGFDTSGLGLHGWIAMMLGILFTSGLAVGLMAAIFASAAGGYDAGGSGHRDPGE